MKYRTEKWDLREMPELGHLRLFGNMNGDTTLAAAKLYVLFFKDVRAFEGRGKAVRGPEDYHDSTVGGLLATGRALVDLGKTMQNEAWEIIRKRDKRNARGRTEALVVGEG